MRRRKSAWMAIALVSVLAAAHPGNAADRPKMATDIPPQITTPDTVNTRIGTLKFFDGYPDGMAATNLAQELGAEMGDAFNRREIMSLIRGYYGIKDPQLQADILRLIAKLGNRELDDEA